MKWKCNSDTYHWWMPACVVHVVEVPTCWAKQSVPWHGDMVAMHQWWVTLPHDIMQWAWGVEWFVYCKCSLSTKLSKSSMSFGTLHYQYTYIGMGNCACCSGWDAIHHQIELLMLSSLNSVHSLFLRYTFVYQTNLSLQEAPSVRVTLALSHMQTSTTLSQVRVHRTDSQVDP